MKKNPSPIKDFLPVKELTIYTDGASRGNPGEAGAGAIIYGEEGTVIKKVKKYLGTTTNNVAEYMALIIALNEALRLKGEILHLFSDSELMVRQIKGIYKVRDRKMQALWREVKKLLAQFIQYDIICIDRRKNKEADELANLAIDEQI
ncbi:MAG: ribonuclease HI family protein [Thermodesulfobacteriota bacterium]|nr:ribonuclease HI family protein [Thermodesulfobacteriota bacterium]